MAFLRNSVSFTRYRLLDALPAALAAELPDKLRQFSFRDIDDLPEERSWGWVNFDDLLDAEWRVSPPRKGGEYIVFSLRLDTRRVPASVLKKHFALALREEEARLRAQGKNYVARERKKELREQALLFLKRRFLPIPAEFQVIWNMASGQIFIATLSSKVLELFEELFLRSFGLHLSRLDPSGLADALLPEEDLDRLDLLDPANFKSGGAAGYMEQSRELALGQDFLTWLWYRGEVAGGFVDSSGEEFSVRLERRIVVQGLVRGEGGDVLETASVSGRESELREARLGLTTGKKVSRALIRLERDEESWEFYLKAEDFGLGGFKTPRTDAAREKDADPDALFFEKEYLLEKGVGFLDALYLFFLRLRLSREWPAEADALRLWMYRES
jgi:hypothetical protein